MAIRDRKQQLKLITARFIYTRFRDVLMSDFQNRNEIEYDQRSMDKLVEAVTKAPKTRSKNDDDFADRLSSGYTVVLLIVFAVLVGIIEVGVDSEVFRYQSDSFIENLYSLYS